MSDYHKKQHLKLTQVIHNFFTKAVQIIHQARVSSNSTSPSPSSSVPDWDEKKINKWFNLYIATSPEVSKEDLRLWKSQSLELPPMIIETYLDLRKLGSRQTVVLKDDCGGSWPVTKGGGKKQEVVLERWLIEFDPSEVSGSTVDELPSIYKQAIILFRGLYAYTRLMPAYKLGKRLSSNSGSDMDNPLVLGIKVLDGKQPISSKGRVGLSKPIIVQTSATHMNQKHFQPIQTTLGTLKVSIAYRTHCDFCVQDSEEILSTHFKSIDDGRRGGDDGTHHVDKRVSIVSSSVSPCSSYKEKRNTPTPTPTTTPSTHYNNNTNNIITTTLTTNNTSSSISTPTNVTTPSRPTIQPFKIGSISNSPPPSLERRFSITSNKSTSNASLVAMLRNPRNSTSLSTGVGGGVGGGSATTSSIPITSSGSCTTPISGAIPRSVSSSHAEDTHSLPHSGESGTTPRFLSSFGSRASRRYLSTSMRNSSIPHDVASSGLVSSSGAPLSGIYIDDDISDFVKMIDSKSDLRFSSYNSDAKNLSYQGGSNSQIDALSRFQQLKNQHQQLGDSVNASLILTQNPQSSSTSNSGPTSSPAPGPQIAAISLQPTLSSRRSSRSRASLHSKYSPPASMGSYDNHIPSIHSRLREESTNMINNSISKSSSESCKNSYGYSQSSNHSFVRSTVKLVSSPVATATLTHAKAQDSVSGLATTPSAYTKQREIQYENVFEDDDDDDGEDFYLTKKTSSKDPVGKEYYDDDLLFAMSDMNLTK